MGFSRGFIVALSRALTGAIYRVHDEALARVPASGPLIIVMNHVNIWEIPLLYAHLQPRRVRGLVLAVRWKNPLLAWMLNAVQAIPLERGGINRSSFYRALEALQAGEIVLMMPEGTRSGDGRLRKGHPGVALLALKSGAPLLPVVTYGGETYRENLKRLRRTDIFIQVGEPFTLGAETEAVTGAGSKELFRKELVDEVMYRMAALLPPEYRGVYAEGFIARNAPTK